MFTELLILLIFLGFLIYIPFRIVFVISSKIAMTMLRPSRPKIIQKRKEQARSIQFSFSPEKTIDGLQHFWPGSIINSGNVMEGDVENIKVIITDFTVKNSLKKIDYYVGIIFQDADLEIPPFFMFPHGELTTIGNRYKYDQLISPPILSLYGYDCLKKEQKELIQSFFKSVQSLHEKRPFRLFFLEKPSFSAIGSQNGQLIIVKRTPDPLKDHYKALVGKWIILVEIFHDIAEEWQKALPIT